jgi:hypothetical protein
MDVRDVVLTIFSISLGIMLVGYLLIPISVDVLATITNTTWQTLVKLVVTFSIVLLLLIGVYGFSGERKTR